MNSEANFVEDTRIGIHTEKGSQYNQLPTSDLELGLESAKDNQLSIENKQGHEVSSPPNHESIDTPIERSRIRDIQWSHVNFLVGKRKILDNCWGEAKTGQLVAVMGPSGAGKSSLLNVLAGRSASGGKLHVEGKVTFVRVLNLL
jgi:ABC-type transport system involved in cytochrome bd biosynthesis fused ATPase/permease subunit